MLTKNLFPAEDMLLGTAMLMYTGVGAASVVVPLVLIGLVFLIMTKLKKRGEAYCDDTLQFHTYSMLEHSQHTDAYF